MRPAASANELDAAGLRVRIKRSLEVLRPARRFTSPARSPYKIQPRPESVELARSQYLEGEIARHLLPKSLSFLAKDKQPKREFRSSLRSSDSNEIKESFGTASSALDKARSISSSLRSRFKKTFTRPAASLPPQQLDASRVHFGDGAFSDGGNGGFDNYGIDHITDSRRNSLYNSSAEDQNNAEDFQQFSKISHVNRSSGSLTSNSNSRVTSWTNSTNTSSIRELPLERKRLSVIQEDGSPYQPSCSAGTHLGGVAVFRKPLAGALPDNQRLYSALTKRMNQESVEIERLATITQHGTDDAEEPKTSSDTRPSIRKVRSESIVGISLPGSEHEELSFDKNAWDEKPSLTPQTLQENIKRRKEKLQEQEAQSKFFPHSGEGRSATKSPFRKHLDTLKNRSVDDMGSQHVYGGENGHSAMPKHPRFALSSESVYSTMTNGGVNPDYHRRDFSNISMTVVDKLPGEQGHVTTYPPARITNVQTENSARQDLEAHTRYQLTPVKQPEACPAESYPKMCQSKGSTHFRENAQIETEHTSSLPWRVFDGLANRTFGATRKASPCDENQGSRSPILLSRLPDQLSVAKKRFPLLNVKQVTRNNTPVPSRSSSFTRSQSGLLQQTASAEKRHDKSPNEHQNSLTASLRKISPRNVAHLLKGSKSMPVTTSHKQQHQKENRPGSSGSQEAASTPGPAYLAVRSGNSVSRTSHDNSVEEGESPTNMIKATLSARLSRPFNMDTPELNRPFDSMYLGKREVGLTDTTGGRLSVAHKPLDVRGPQGYGGLGPSPFETPRRDEEETALPHIPTPEEETKKQGAVKNDLRLKTGSKRMVSNFLKSRRLGRASDKENQRSSESNGGMGHSTPSASSPLFV